MEQKNDYIDKKNILIALGFILISINANSKKYFTRSGNTSFSASVKTFEPVYAENNSSTFVLNTNDGQVAGLVFIQSFNFRLALMQEHYNENYMDSDIYPKSIFKGKILNFYFDELNNKSRKYTLEGELEIKGKKQIVKTIIRIKKANSNILISGQFKLDPTDFNIKIPKITRKKISDSVTIKINYVLEEKK